MYLAIFLSAILGVGLCAGGFYIGFRIGRGPAQGLGKRKPKRSRPPKCYVVAPGGPDEEQKKKRKKRSASGDVMASEFDEKHIKGIDVKI